MAVKEGVVFLHKNKQTRAQFCCFYFLCPDAPRNYHGFPSNPPAGVNTNLVTLLGLAAPGPPHDTVGNVDENHVSLIDLGTTDTHDPHLIMEMFEQVFSEEEMEHNPLVQRLHQRLGQQLDRLETAANNNPSVKFLFFVIPVIALAALAYTAFGVAPEFVGLLGLFIPALIVATMTNVGVGREVRSADSSGKGDRLWQDLQIFPKKNDWNDFIETVYQEFQRNILLFKEKYHSI
ncbi:uncharacterized protein [Panulirus ornatus]|uniref:uncharacterized protein n=1 Tax=Panulirus ornatus TaxID=150431 RepID=UPI003A89E813